MASLGGLEHGRGASGLRLVVTSWVVLRLAGNVGLDGAVHNAGGVALAATDDADRGGSGMGQLHAERVGELGVRITREHHERGVGVDLLVLGPRLHHGAVIDAVDEHAVHARGLEIVLVLKVSGDLDGGSGRSESAREADEEDLLALAELSEVDLLGREPVVQLDVIGDRESGASGLNNFLASALAHV